MSADKHSECNFTLPWNAVFHYNLFNYSCIIPSIIPLLAEQYPLIKDPFFSLKTSIMLNFAFKNDYVQTNYDLKLTVAAVEL